MDPSLQPATSRTLNAPDIIEAVSSQVPQSVLGRSRYLSRAFDRHARRHQFRSVDMQEWRRRMDERLGPESDKHSHSKYDDNVFAMTYNPSQEMPYTLPQTLSVYPNLSTVYAENESGQATAELISDRMVVTHCSISDPDDRRTLLDQMNNGFLSQRAISNRPKVEWGSELSDRKVHRVVRVKMTIPESRHLAFLSTSPEHGPHALHEGGTSIVYNMAAFGNMITEHAKKHTQPIESIDFTFLNDDRQKCYQRVAKVPWPEIFKGRTNVSIASPSNAPSLFALIDDPDFPGTLKNAKNLSLDVSLSPPPEEDANVSWAYTSPHLESVTFRVQDRSRARDLQGQGDWRGVERIVADEDSDEEEEEDQDNAEPTPSELARPFLGSTSTRFVFTPAPGSECLTRLCEQATLAIKSIGEEVGQVYSDVGVEEDSPT